MSKITQIFIFIILLALNVSAQGDSLTFVTADWHSLEIAKGIVWKQYLFKGTLFGSNQNINILEVKKSKRISFEFGYETKKLKLTSKFGKESDALAAVNGTFFNTKEGGSVDFLKAYDLVVHHNQLKDGKREFHQKAAVVLKNSTLRIEKWNGNDEWETHLHAKGVMVSGPLLIFHKGQEPLDSASFNLTRHPRTALAITNSHQILLITVDGRNENAAGMSLFELRNILRWLNAGMGINLDGGGSTTLWIYNQPANGVVNYPCDNRKWDHTGERRVANVIIVKKR